MIPRCGRLRPGVPRGWGFGFGLSIWSRAKWCSLVFGTLHVTPGLTQASYEEEVSAYFRGMWKCRRVVFQGDINAPLSWLQSPEGDLAVAGDGKALILLEYLQRSGLQPAAPLRAQQQLPTSRPRQSGRAGSRIDLFAT